MKKSHCISFSIVLVFISLTTATAQMTCDDFAVGQIEPSGNPNSVFVNIFFDAPENQFANYPYVSAIMDCNNDTIVTGEMEIFGLFGQTGHSFLLSSDLNGACQPLQVVFVYTDNLGEQFTCFLPYSTLGLNLLISEPVLTIYPNPVKEQLNIESDLDIQGAVYQIVDLLGRTVMQGVFESQNANLDVTSLSSGIYNLIIGDSTPYCLKMVKE